jgi:hypothetical protein
LARGCNGCCGRWNNVDHAPPPNQLIRDCPLGRENVPEMAPFSPMKLAFSDL